MSVKGTVLLTHWVQCVRRTVPLTYHLNIFSTCSAVALSHSAVIFVPSAVYSVCKTTERSIRKETTLPRSYGMRKVRMVRFAWRISKIVGT